MNSSNMSDFEKYAKSEFGVGAMTLHRYSSATDSYINPTIIEERKLNVASMDVFSRLMMDRIIFLGVPIDDDVANIVQAQLLFLASAGESNSDITIYLNTPGGSVSASVKIRTALDLLMAEKPLIASYGDYAASGGYWISCGCQKVYSDANSITGSIGVFSMIPEFSGTANKLGVGIESVGSNKHSDMFSLMRPFDKEELAYMQASVEDIYEMFVNLVATSRDQEPAQIDAIAQGRVWMGSDALELGLVDQIGTLEDAISYAAAMADLHSSDEYKVVGYPKPLTMIEDLMSQFGQGPEEPSILTGTPFQGMGKAVEAMQNGNPATVYARLPYSIEIR